MKLEDILSRKPFVICEVGSNWASFDDARNSVALAAKCGADAVKFQAYTHEALYGMPGNMAGVLPLEWLPKLAEKAKACGIEFMCSAFSPELVRAVDPYVSIHKVASSEFCHLRMLETLKTLGKPVILSTGAQTMRDIASVLRVMRGAELALMYCVGAYPAKTVRLDHIPYLKSEFGVPVGYSCHALDVFQTCVSAVRHYGAPIIEKHVNFVGANGPDSPHSISTDEFRDLCLALKKDLFVFGSGAEEKDMMLRHKRRIIATRDIEPGEEFREGVNFGIYRSKFDDSHAENPLNIARIEGEIASRPIKAGHGIWVDDAKQS